MVEDGAWRGMKAREGVRVKFSVVIPVYNVAPYLRACLDSLLAQTEGDWEAVCVDDGSTDASWSILQDYAKRDPRFRVFHQANAGVSAARNRALEAVAGDWVLFLDGDDTLRDCALADVAQLIDAHGSADMIGFGLQRAPEAGGFAWEAGTGEVCVLDVSREIPTVLSGCGFSQFAYRRTVLGDVRFPPFVRGEDLTYACFCFARAQQIVLCKKMEYAYRVRAGSAVIREITSDAMRDSIGYRKPMFTALQESRKEIGAGFWRTRGNGWIEWCPNEILKHRLEGEWKGVWDLWLTSLNDAVRFSFFSRWQKFVIGVMLRTRSVWLARMFCVVPYHIKLWRARR